MRHLLTISLLVIFYATQAQESLVMTRPLQFNGGLAGNVGYSRLSTNTHSIIVNEKYKSFNSNISYDWLSNKLKGGIGIHYEKGQFSTHFTPQYFANLGVVYSPKFIIKQKLALSPYFRAGYARRYTSFRPSLYNALYSDFGFLLNKKYWLMGYKMGGIDTKMKHGGKELVHTFQFGRFFSLYKEGKYGLGILYQLDFWYSSQYLYWTGPSIYDMHLYSVFDKPSWKNVVIRNRVYPYLKLSRFTLGLSMSTNLVSNFTYNHKEKWKVGYAIRKVSVPNIFDTHTIHEIGVQYIFKKKEENKLFSIPLKN